MSEPKNIFAKLLDNIANRLCILGAHFNSRSLLNVHAVEKHRAAGMRM